MKLLKIAAIVSSIRLLLQFFGYVNLMTSYKYEVDLMETNIKTDESLSSSKKTQRLEEVKQREQEIFFQFKIIKVLSTALFLGLIVVLYFLLVKTKK